MKHIFILAIFFNFGFASINSIKSFEAEFIQSVTDDKNKVLTYTGHVIATNEQNAIWKYIKPIRKDIYVNAFNVTIVEPEIEQVIIRKLEFSIDFFNIIKNAKKIKKDLFEAVYKESKFTITTQNELINSISYVDDFENNVKVVFDKQIQNEEVDLEVFTPNIPLEFDIIRD